jgi:hypothetical protein
MGSNYHQPGGEDFELADFKTEKQNAASLRSNPCSTPKFADRLNTFPVNLGRELSENARGSMASCPDIVS